MHANNENNDRTWPECIPLGNTKRPYEGGDVAPRDISHVKDLPSRLFLGDIDPDSFRVTPEGWQVSYRDQGGDVAVEIDCCPNDKRLTISQDWKGKGRMITDGPADDFAGILKQMSGGLPEVWERLSSEKLQSTYNLHYLLGQSSSSASVYFPDGYAKTIVCPVSVKRMRDCLDWYRAVDTDPTVRAPLQAYLKLTWSVVNYVQGKSPQADADPAAVECHTLQSLGTPRASSAALQTNSSGVSAMTLRRGHYVLVVTCLFRDLDRTVELLHSHDLISDSPSDTFVERYPDAPEFAAVVMPPGHEIMARETQFFDRQQTRRVAYPQVISLEEFKELTKQFEESDGDPSELIGKAERLSAVLLGE
jgi:hypothetical protein